MRPGNPFAERAERARARANREGGQTAHDKAMAQAFPLGAGYGRAGGAKRIERTIDRAVRYVDAVREAEYLEAQAAAFDAGEINAQGRSWDRHKQAASEKREAAADRRKARIAAAKAACEGKPRHEIAPEVWADAAGYMGGSGRALVMAEQRAHIEEQAVPRG